MEHENISDYDIINIYRQGTTVDNLLKLTNCKSEFELNKWFRKRGICYGCNT